jgi:formylglycine-generating enzyme required for sulfatase activity
MKMLKTTGFIYLCCILLLACGFNGEEPATPNPGGKKSSSSGEKSSSSRSSSSKIDINIEWQNAPEESAVHGTVEISLDSFMISKYLITQYQYQSVMGNNPSKGEKNDNLPIEGVTWFKAVEFCKKLSVLHGLDSNAIRLPTEAEWEFASYAPVAVIQRYEYYWEWTNDCFDSVFPYNGITSNPSGPPDCVPNFKVRKGASGWDARYFTDPSLEDIGGGYISFRVVIRTKDYF